VASAALAVCVLSALGLVGNATAAPSTHTDHAAHPPHAEHNVCGRPGPGQASCHVHLLETGDGVRPDAGPTPYGLGPSTIKSVYNFPTSTSAGAGQTIAIVDAYNDATAQADLNTFSTQYGLPCNSCLTKVSQSGSTTSLPPANTSWALEISLDVQWAHAIAPGANLLLVEANTSNFDDLMAAEDYAASHANYVTNSWGGGEFSYESIYDGHFSHPGVSFFVSAGDSGLPAEYPSASPNVISVGGTTLNSIGTPSFSETAWSRGGGGCSLYETPAGAQSSFSQYGQAKCNGKRATPDVSLDANPSSGVSVYDNGYGGWVTVGGTSAGSPMWAARAAVAGAVVNASYVYGNSINFRDITSGNNGSPALVGYDLATGRGSWADVVLVPPPGAPTLNSAIGGAGTASLSWSPPTSGGPAASYNVYRSGSVGPVALLASGVTTTSYNDNGVAPGTYTYDVSAVNSANVEGPASNQLSATVTAVPPGTPTLNTATGGTGTVALGWSAPSSGGPIASYNIYRGTSSGSESLLTTGVASTGYTDNVAPGVYFYEVTAVNSSNVEGPRSNELSATSKAPGPGAPTLLSASGGTTSVSLGWSAPSGGGTVASYNVYRGTSSGTESLLTSGVSGTAYTDNVGPGTYFYEVTAVNNASVEGPRSNELSATVAAATPGAPTLNTANGGTGSVSLAWTAPSSGGPIASYNIYRGTSSGSEILVVNGVTGTIYNDSVAPGTYFYEVTAVNGSSVQGPRSNELSATVAAATPGAPTLNTANGGTGSVSLAWTAPSSGGPIASYKIYRGTSSGSEILVVSGVTGTIYNDSVAPGTYFYEVTAVNGSSVEGPRSNELSATASAPVDEAPSAGFTKSCTFSSCSFSSTSTDPDGRIVTYAWSGTNNVSGSATRISHTYTAAGTYSLSLVVHDSSGQQATATGGVTCSPDQYHRLVCT
jgi:fibronectin type 3 domain-containing protein